jgi:hypothetical protein
MDPHRKSWNEGQKKLRLALEHSRDSKAAIELFFVQHAMVHSGRMTKSRLHSFEDEVLDSLSEKSIRRIPPNGRHSIAWVLWHLARIEDVAIGLLLGSGEQTLFRENHTLGTKFIHTGNGMSSQDIARLSAEIDIAALQKYRIAVGRATRDIVKKIKADDFAKKVEPSRVCRIDDQGAMLPNAQGIVNYWASRTIAGLLLMPPTRHCFLHLNEARRIRSTVLRFARS